MLQGSTKLYINHLFKPRTKSKIKEINEEDIQLITVYTDNFRIINYLTIEDNSEGFSLHEFYDILLTYDMNVARSQALILRMVWRKKKRSHC